MPPLKKMTGCDPVDIVYYTFWPIVAFSFFIATAELGPRSEYRREDTNAILLANVLVFEKFAHMFALLCLIVSLLESYLAFQSLRSPACKRIIFLETNAMMAALFLVILSLLDCLHGYFPMSTPLSSTQYMLCKLVPFAASFVILLYQLGRIMFNSGIMTTESGRVVLRILPTA